MSRAAAQPNVSDGPVPADPESGHFWHREGQVRAPFGA